MELQPDPRIPEIFRLNRRAVAAYAIQIFDNDPNNIMTTIRTLDPDIHERRDLFPAFEEWNDLAIRYYKNPLHVQAEALQPRVHPLVREKVRYTARHRVTTQLFFGSLSGNLDGEHFKLNGDVGLERNSFPRGITMFPLTDPVTLEPLVSLTLV